MSLKRLLIFISVAVVSLSACKSKKKSKTTTDKTDKKAKVECNCPKVKVCASSEAIKRVKERCTNWQFEEMKSIDPKAEKPNLNRKELYITSVNPIGIIKYYRTDNTLACREADLNGDGLMDLFYFYDGSGKNIKEVQQDWDRDGIIDHKIIYRNGVIFKELQNTDADEKFWEVEKTYNDGVITQIALKVINPSGSPMRVCPQYNYFENFDTDGVLISISWDIDCDGDMDRIRNKDGRFESEKYKHLKIDKGATVEKLRAEDTSIAPAVKKNVTKP
ncbi:hypothetical protein KKF34_14640 [Myxococcota bacterium]|nr:hypothetical protein [Myxococcota bacterium]MBU1382110.1 hypothetical protein [Myxococcota bacterium]MBU1498112.1 hypothetical protein [Myxococcota bacterium]